MKFKVSVIIPCYNCEKYLEETLSCLETQTYKDFEVICVNDGSCDHTLSILNAWKEKQTISLTVIDQENAGVSSARNRGIDESRGEYLMFCDADDGFHEKMIEVLVFSLESTGADTAYCTLSRNRKCLETIVYHPENIIKSQDEFMHDLLYKMGQIGFYCYLYKKKIIEKFGLGFDINTRHFEDREFNWKYLANCNTAAFTDLPLYWYRIAENSATTMRTVAWRTDSIEAVKRIEAYYEINKIPYEKELKSYLFQRVIFGIAKNYCIAGESNLFKRLCREYDVRACMKVTSRDNDKMVALASNIYLLSPSLFYLIIGKLGRFRK